MVTNEVADVLAQPPPHKNNKPAQTSCRPAHPWVARISGGQNDPAPSRPLSFCTFRGPCSCTERQHGPKKKNASSHRVGFTQRSFCQQICGGTLPVVDQMNVDGKGHAASTSHVEVEWANVWANDNRQGGAPRNQRGCHRTSHMHAITKWVDPLFLSFHARLWSLLQNMAGPVHKFSGAG